MNKINVAFAGCGFLGLYQTGAVAALTHHGKSFLTSVKRYKHNFIFKLVIEHAYKKIYFYSKSKSSQDFVSY